MLTTLFALTCLVQAPTPKSLELTPAVRKEVVERLLSELERNYVFPRVAEDIDFEVRERLSAGVFDKSADPHAFAQLLTDALRDVSSDRHLSVSYSPEPIPEEAGPREGPGADGPPAEELEAIRREGAWDNFGFESVRRLAGNVGYIDLRGFMPTEVAAPTAHAAMALVANTDALVFDLRENGGGSPQMVQLISSYLFGPEPVHLNDLYFRPTDETREFWTRPELPGPRYGDKPVYVLTSDYTFSAAEEFAYNLQCLKRATIVGKTTGGGAHPGGMFRLHKHFRAFISTGRAINPITKTNWEGVGVKPEVECETSAALARAHELALQKLIEGAKDPAHRRRLEGALASAQLAVRQAYSTR